MSREPIQVHVCYRGKQKPPYPDKSCAKAYSPQGTYAERDSIHHHKFGYGRVVELRAGVKTMRVLFEDMHTRWFIYGR